MTIPLLSRLLVELYLPGPGNSLFLSIIVYFFAKEIDGLFLIDSTVYEPGPGIGLIFYFARSSWPIIPILFIF